MKREEFIEECSRLSQKELLVIALESRKRAAHRIPPQVQEQFRSLDDVTEVQEIYRETLWGKTHLYLVRPVRTADSKLPVIVNIHGGGWCLDHTERDIYMSRRFASRLHALVIDIDYVLAPEYPYPAAIEQIEALFQEFPALLPSWNGDTDSIVVCGQSAGGNLAAAVLERGNIPGELGIRAQILCYLPTDNYTSHFGGRDLDERGKATEYYGFFYNRNFEERKNHDVSLVFSTPKELENLPATDIITAGLDDLMPEGKRYNDLLRENGIKGSYRCFEKSRHGFLVNLYDEYQECEDYVVSLMKRYLYSEREDHNV